MVSLELYLFVRVRIFSYRGSFWFNKGPKFKPANIILIKNYNYIEEINVWKMYFIVNWIRIVWKIWYDVWFTGIEFY